MFKINVDTKKAGQILVRLAAESRAMARDLESYAPEIADVAAEFILGEIRTGLPEGIGDFMADRTKIDIAHSGHTITLTISGMSEGEAGHPPSRHGVPKVKNPATNLWMTHEFGIPSGGGGGGSLWTYTKDVGGVKSTRSGVAGYGRGSPYVGAIAKLATSITEQLNVVLRPIGAIAGNNVIADVIESATQGKVIIERSAMAALRRAGVSAAALAAMGVVKVSVTSRGQINLLGTTGGGRRHFISGGGGVPTTIKG